MKKRLSAPPFKDKFWRWCAKNSARYPKGNQGVFYLIIVFFLAFFLVISFFTKPTTSDSIIRLILILVGTFFSILAIRNWGKSPTKETGYFLGNGIPYTGIPVKKRTWWTILIALLIFLILLWIFT